MAVNYTDFDKIWASASPLTPYEFNENNYKAGWNFVGATPPSRQMWDAFMKNADEKLQYLYHHEDIPLGHEYFTFNPNVPQGSLPLFGGEYSRETYSDLWAWVQTQTGYLKTEAEWQTLATANNGNVPFYSDGDGSTTFRVPSLRCWVKGANGTVTEVGSYLEAGLPNITGYFDLRNAGSSSTINVGTTGSFSSEVGTYQGSSLSLSGSGGSSRVSINASNSNSIYGNSNTVQPPSIVGMWLVKAYGVVEETGTIDEQQYIDDRMEALKNVYLPANYTNNQTTDISSDVSLNITSGNASQGLPPKVFRFGNIVNVWLSINPTTTINVGSSIDLTIVGVPASMITVYGVGFTGSTTVVINVSPSGSNLNCAIRVLGANLSTNQTFGITFQYFTS